MAEEQVFGRPDVISEGTNATLSTTETAICTVTDASYTVFSQLSMYVNWASLGTHTSIRVRVYFLDETTGSYSQLCKLNTATGSVDDFYYSISATTPALFVQDLPLSASFGYKVTAQGVGGANGSLTIKLLGRNN